MKPDKKKDALTDLVEILDDGYDDTEPNEGRVVASSGDIVTLSANDKELTILAKKLLAENKERKGKW